MTEKEIVALLKSINIKIEALQSQMVMFQEALQPDLEYKTRVEEEVEVLGNMEEDLLQDLTNIVVMAQTPKAILAVKNGYKKWVALSHMLPRDKGFVLGTLYENIELHKDSKWILNKAWEKFKPTKKGG